MNKKISMWNDASSLIFHAVSVHLSLYNIHLLASCFICYILVASQYILTALRKKEDAMCFQAKKLIACRLCLYRRHIPKLSNSMHML